MSVLAASGALWALLYLPLAFGAPQADHDPNLALIELQARHWLAHGRPLAWSMQWGGGAWIQGLAEQPPWSPAVALALVFGSKAGGMGWMWAQLSLGGAFVYGWFRELGACHRGALVGALAGWCSLWLARHAVDGHLAWGALAFCVSIAWTLSAAHRLRWVPALLAAQVLLLLSSSHLQAPVYGLPVVLAGLLQGLKRHPHPWRLLGTSLLACLPAVALTAPLWQASLGANVLYDRAALVAAQDARFATGPGPKLLGVVLPFASYGRFAEGNLLALLPALVLTRRWPSKTTGLAAAGLLLLALLPTLGPVRQLERFLWAGVLLAAFHVAKHIRALPVWGERLTLGLSAGGAALCLALRWAMGAGLPPPAPPAPGLVGVALPSASLDLGEDTLGGVWSAVRSGLVVHRPPGHVALPLVPARETGLVLTPGFRASGEDGALRVAGPWAPGVRVTVQLRAEVPWRVSGCAEVVPRPSDAAMKAAPQRSMWLVLEATGRCRTVQIQAP